MWKMLERIKRTEYIAQLNFNNLDSNCFKHFKSKLLAWLLCQDTCAFMQVVEYCYAWIHSHECKTQPDECIRKIFVKLFSHFMKCHDQGDDKQGPEKIEKYYPLDLKGCDPEVDDKKYYHFNLKGYDPEDDDKKYHFNLKGYDPEDNDEKYYHFNLKGYDPEYVDKIGQIAEKTSPDDHKMSPTYFISNGKMRELKDKNGELALGRKRTDTENAILFKKPKIAMEEELQSTSKHDLKTDPDLLQSNYLNTCLYLAAHVNNFYTMELFVSRAKVVTETSKSSLFCKQSELQLGKERMLINSNNKLEIRDHTWKPDEIVNTPRMGVMQVIAKFMKQKQVVAGEYETLTYMCTFLDSCQQITEHEIHVTSHLQVSKRTDEDMYILERSKERHEGGEYGSLIDYNDHDFLLGLTDKLKAPEKLLRTHRKRKGFLPKFENENIKNVPEGTGRTDDFSPVAVRYRVAVLLYARFFCFTQPSSQGTTSPASRTQWLDIVQSMALVSANAQLLVRVIFMVFKQRTANETRTVCLQLEMQHSHELDISFMTNTNNDFILELMALFRQQMAKTEKDGSDEWLFTVHDTYLALRASSIHQWQQLDLAKVFQGSVSKQLISPAFLAATRSSPSSKASMEAGNYQGLLIKANQALCSEQAGSYQGLLIQVNQALCSEQAGSYQGLLIQANQALCSEQAGSYQGLLIQANQALCSEQAGSHQGLLIQANQALCSEQAGSYQGLLIQANQALCSEQAQVHVEMKTTNSMTDNPTASLTLSSPQQSVYVQETEGLSTQTANDSEALAACSAYTQPIDRNKTSLASIATSSATTSVEITYQQLSLPIQANTPPESFTVYDGPTASFSFRASDNSNTNIDQQIMQLYPSLRFPVQVTATVGLSIERSSIEDLFIQGSSIQGSPIQVSSIQGSPIQGSSIQGSSIQGSSIQGSSIQGSPLQGSSIESQVCSSQGKPIFDETLFLSNYAGVTNCENRYFTSNTQNTRQPNIPLVQVRDHCCATKSCVENVSAVGVTRSVHAETDSGLVPASVSIQSDLRTRSVSTALTSHFLSEPHAAGSLPPWATGIPRIQLSEAASPEYINLMKRCGTYSNWPETSGQHPRNLALAGFYYTGKDRQIRCFFCGVVVQWSPDCNAWEEHIRRSPTCQYLVQMKGEQFVTQVQSRLREKVKKENQ